MLPYEAFFRCYWSGAIAHERGGEKKKRRGKKGEKRRKRGEVKRETLYYFTLYIDIALGVPLSSE